MGAGHIVPPPFDRETMKLPAAILLLLIALIGAACSSASADSVDEIPATTTTVAAPVTTATTAPVEEPADTTPARSPLAESVVPLGSARYDVEDHVDDGAVTTSISIERRIHLPFDTWLQNLCQRGQCPRSTSGNGRNTHMTGFLRRRHTYLYRWVC